MNVIFLEPSFPTNQPVRPHALREAGATVIGIGERPVDWLDGEVHDWLAHYEQVSSVVDEFLIDTVRRIQGHVWVDRLEATIEAHVMAVAGGVHDPGHVGAHLCRDKPAMKEALARRRGAVRPLRRRAPATGRSSPTSASPSSSNRPRQRALRAPSSTPNSTGQSLAAVSTTAPRWRSRSSSRATRSTRSPSTATWPWTSSRTTTRTCSRRCGPAGSRPVRHHQPHQCRELPRRPAGQRHARHRHLGQRPGMVRRAQGSLLLGDRMSAARRPRLGPLRRRQRHRHLPRVGQRHRPRSRTHPRGASPPG